MLQWGRVRENAEGCRRRRGRPGTTRFNGAAFARTRKGPRARRSCRWRTRFNGAAFARTRKGETAEELEANAEASMGPRSRERGRLIQQSAERIAGNASMGPRSRERGRRRRAARPRRAHHASMGPRSRERGRRWPMTSAAEEDLRFNGAAFARTRKAPHVRELGIHERASMGPRSRERGRVRDVHGVLGYAVASMGPRSRERGRECVARVRRVHEKASMGPRSRERGRPASPPRMADLPSFNGAAFARTRKGR